MTVISSEEFIALGKMPPEERFDYAIEKMIERKHLWGLFGEDGWVMLKAQEDACVPCWPHEECAAAWMKEDFPDCQPKQIELSDWTEKWLPGMKNNGTLVLVFPLSNDEEGIMLDAEEMLQCINEDVQRLAAR